MNENWDWPFIILLGCIFYGETLFPIFNEVKQYKKHIIMLLTVYTAVSLAADILFFINIFPYEVGVFILIVCWAGYIIPNLIRISFKKNKLFTQITLKISLAMTVISIVLFTVILIYNS